MEAIKEMEESKTKQQLFSKEDLKKLIVPLLFEQALAITVGMADTVMISSAGEAAVSGVSLIDMFNNLIISVLAALATGGAVVTSQFLGAGKKEDACKSAKQLIVSSVCITIGISILVMVFCNGIISLFFGKIEADVFHNAVIYMMISALSFPFLALYNSCAALFRSMGNSKITLKVSVVENIINIGGNALGVYVLGLGVAGVAGSGQRELLESIAGLYPIASGSVTYYSPEDNKPQELVGKDPMDIRKAGIAMSFVPEDRLGMGLVGSMGMTGNMMLRSWRKGHGIFLDRKNPEALAQRIWQELEVVTPSTSFPVRRMSGGNVQKVLVGREIAQQPAVLMTAYAVRGLDINTSYTIYNLLTEQKMKGVAVVYVGEDLDVLLELCDRIVVLCGGQVSGVVDGRTTNKMEVGALMTRMGGGKADE